MPLIKKIGKENYKDSGKPASLAVAYGVQRNRKPKKMADGGPVEPTAADKIAQSFGYPNAGPHPKKMAHGGEVEEHYSSIADAILAKKRAGNEQVDLEANSEEQPNQFDDLNEEEAGAPQYDLDQLSAQPEDSNEHGDDVGGEDHSLSGQIRKKMRDKR